MVFDKASVRDADVDGKRVPVRVDFNVPPTGKRSPMTPGPGRAANHRVPDRSRGQGHFCSHLGRPKGQVVPELRWRRRRSGCRS